MQTDNLPSQALLKGLLLYEPDSGRLYWQTRRLDHFRHLPASKRQRACSTWNARYAGKEAFATLGPDGYLRGSIDNASHLAHRVIWKLVHGVAPHKVDHKDGVRSNNRLRNLFEVDDLGNAANQSAHKDSRTGVRGVSYCAAEAKPYRASIYVAGVNHRLGRFGTLAEAARVRRDAEIRHGFTSRNRI